MLNLHLQRPLAIFDIESTGINKKTDRIIDLAIVKLLPKGKSETHTFRVHPQIPIPPESTAIHGINDADVKDCPTFPLIAQKVSGVLQDCDLGGYNVLGYDIPLLIEEFARAGMRFEMEGRRVIDAQRIFHRREPRDLTAALKFYCGEFHLGAHGAIADVEATLRVLEGQFQRYTDLPTNIDELDAFCNPRDPNWVDKTGKLKWSGQDIVLNFGRKQGEKLKDIVREDPGFIRWMLNNDFPQDTQDVLKKAQKGEYPAPPKTPAE